MSVRHILTVDLGTSGPKAAVVSEAGRLVGAARRSVDTVHGADGSAVQDPEEVWRAVVATATAALSEASVPASSVVGVVASAQYSSIVPVRADGTPVGPMVTWMDQRSSPRRLRRLAGYPRGADNPLSLARSVRIHGLAPVEAGMSLNHMRWIRFATPEVYDRADALLEPVDYVTARLSGRCTANRCTSLMQILNDNRQGPGAAGRDRWHPDLVAASLIERSKLAEPVAVGSVVGTLVPAVAEALGLPVSTPVLSGLNDTQAGAVAARAWTADHAGLAIGTTSVIVTHIERKKLNPLRSLFTMPAPLGDGYLVAAENGVAGAAVDHFVDRLVFADDTFGSPEGVSDRYEAFNRAIEASPPGAGGVMFLPWLAGSLAPRADGAMRGGFVGMGLDTSRDDLARAVAEGVALNLGRLQGPVETFVGREISHYSFYGGGSASAPWAQILADVLQRPVHRLAAGGFANSIGTAIFGLDHLGIASADSLASGLEVVDGFEPRPAHRARYQELAEAFDQAFTRTRPVMHALSRPSSR